MDVPSILPKITLGAALLGATGGVIGAFAVLRQRALLGDTLAHASLPGICVAYLLFASASLWALSAGALVAGLLGVLCVTLIPRWTRTSQDAALGLVLSTFFGVGVVLLSVIQKSPTGGQAGLNTFLFGEVAGLQSRDVVTLGVVGFVSITAVTVLLKELKLLCFDEEFAAAQGWPTYMIDLAVMAAITVVTIVSLPICGVILMAAVLIFPCTIARYWTDRFGVVMILSGLLGAGAAAAGVLTAHFATPWVGALPPGPLIVLCSAALFIASMLLAPGRGLVARAVQNLLLQIDVATDHVLRRLFEMTERKLPQRVAVPLRNLRRRLTADAVTLRLVLWLVKWRGWTESPAAGQIALTDTGLQAAARVTRTHRLWELFLVAHADIAADHVHRDADDLEHHLPPELVASLEIQLAREDRLPLSQSSLAVPQSPHEVDASI